MTRLRWLLLLPVVLILLLYAPTQHFFANQYDDTYVTYRYALNLANGDGMVFNVGERTDAASSFLYTVVLAFFWMIGLTDLEFVGGLLGVLSLGVVSVLVYRLAAHLSGDRWIACLLAVACGANGFLAGWTLSGMDTLPWTAVVLWVVFLIVTEADHRVTIGWIVCASLARVEGALLFVPYGLSLVGRRRWGREYLVLGAAIAALALFYVLKHEYYGVWVSHAFEMKQVHRYYQADPSELVRHWWRFGSVAVAASLFALVKRPHWPILAYLGVSAASLLLGPRSDWSRYSVHLLPVVYAFSAVLLVELRTRLPRTAGTSLVAVVVLLLGLQAVRGQQFSWYNMVALADHQRCRREVGTFLANHVRPGAHIASADLGMVAYTAYDHKFVDLSGLTSSDVLDGHIEGRTADEVLSSRGVTRATNTFAAGRDGRYVLDGLLAHYPTVQSSSRYFIDPETPDVQCVSRDGITFQLARLSLKP